MGSSRSQPLYLPLFPGAEGRRFVMLHEPPPGALRGLVVAAPPFAEEMNKCRAMCARMARLLAAQGFVVLQPDLFGTGDSPGDFAQATWEQWGADLAVSTQWLLDRYRTDAGEALPLVAWGVRAGCLLACELARADERFSDLLLWSPPASGRQLLQQFVRLRSAAQWMGGDATRPAPDVRDEWAQQGHADIAGYRVSAALADRLSQAELHLPGAAHTHWFELTASADAAFPPGAQRLLERWQQGGVTASGHRVTGPAFWGTSEIEFAPDLLELSCAVLTARHAPRSAQRAAAWAPGAAHHERPAEEALAFSSRGAALVGVLGVPGGPASRSAHTGVVVVVGGPQYRVGSHRQFVHLARSLAAAGWPVLRFDVRGMGDSEGEPSTFEEITTDIGAAIDALVQRHPTIESVVLWGLCDGASAALLYLDETGGDPRVQGLGLVNPWVRSPEGLARVHVKRYYLQRLRERSFWHKLLRGGVGWSALRGLASTLKTLRRPSGSRRERAPAAARFQARMLRAAEAFSGNAWLALSGRDLTAQEFDEHTRQEPRWQCMLQREGSRPLRFEEADHTFSDIGEMERLHHAFTTWMCEHAGGRLGTPCAEPDRPPVPR